MGEDPDYPSEKEEPTNAPEEAGDENIEKQEQQQPFPEGGGRAWAVALGCGGTLFCTFGFANAFG